MHKEDERAYIKLNDKVEYQGIRTVDIRLSNHQHTRKSDIRISKPQDIRPTDIGMSEQQDKTSSHIRRSEHQDITPSDNRISEHKDIRASDIRILEHQDSGTSDVKISEFQDDRPSDIRILEHQGSITSDIRVSDHQDMRTSDIRISEHHDEDSRHLADEQLSVFQLDQLDNLPIILPEFTATHSELQDSQSSVCDQLQTIQIIKLTPSHNLTDLNSEESLCYLSTFVDMNSDNVEEQVTSTNYKHHDNQVTNICLIF